MTDSEMEHAQVMHILRFKILTWAARRVKGFKSK
jgi:hypothetical protein